MRMQRRRVLAAVSVVGVAWLSGCGEQDAAPKFKATDITGSSVGGDFSMPDFTGRRRTLSEFRGKVVVLFFGFLQCPDVCPTTLSGLAAVMKQLGAKADDVQVVFVTVDPERDTPALLVNTSPHSTGGSLGCAAARLNSNKPRDCSRSITRRATRRMGTAWTIRQGSSCSTGRDVLGCWCPTGPDRPCLPTILACCCASACASSLKLPSRFYSPWCRWGRSITSSTDLRP